MISGSLWITIGIALISNTYTVSNMSSIVVNATDGLVVVLPCSEVLDSRPFLRSVCPADAQIVSVIVDQRIVNNSYADTFRSCTVTQLFCSFLIPSL